MRHTTQIIAVTIATAALVALLAPQASAQEKKKSTIKGAGLGALLGQAIGHDTEATLIGGAIGAGVGHVIGNEKDKQKAEEMTKQSAQPATTQPATQQPAAQQPSEEVEGDPLAGTRWVVGSLSPKENFPEFQSMIIEFENNGKVVTTTTDKANKVTLSEESYRVVDNTLIVNKPGYLINARFAFDGDQLIVSADAFSAVLFRLQPES